MKAILISKEHNFTLEDFIQIVKPISIDGYEVLSASTFMFDLAIASDLLLSLQSFLKDIDAPYHILYIPSDIVHFQQPSREITNLSDCV
ncbi:hypothetical protein ACFODO_20725 [Acinetobacter sichuanensis]|uniref:Uncharacterized protein n=1 Tax=Acinetobacter sichuanensis TaxID=2136183 RepID=A0ABV7BL00_9GAMM